MWGKRDPCYGQPSTNSFTQVVGVTTILAGEEEAGEYVIPVNVWGSNIITAVILLLKQLTVFRAVAINPIYLLLYL